MLKEIICDYQRYGLFGDKKEKGRPPAKIRGTQHIQREEKHKYNPPPPRPNGKPKTR